jgi:hypothetical protein
MLVWGSGDGAGHLADDAGGPREVGQRPIADHRCHLVTGIAHRRTAISTATAAMQASVQQPTSVMAGNVRRGRFFCSSSGGAKAIVTRSFRSDDAYPPHALLGEAYPARP